MQPKSNRRIAFYVTLCILTIIGTFQSKIAYAAPTVLNRDAVLRTDHYMDATAISRLAKGTPVEILKSEAGWVQVRTGTNVGWLRASQLKGGSPLTASTVESGRSGSDNVIAISGIRSVARASRHALIIGIGQYADPEVPLLKGVKYDIDSATRMAGSMAIPKENIQYLRDQDATASHIESEINELAKRTQPGDRVFLYFSGHGSRWYDDVRNKDDCVAALLPADAKPITNQRMVTLLKPIWEKTDKLFVLYDVSYSANAAVQPSIPNPSNTEKNKLTAKFSTAGMPSSCATTSSIRTRSFTDQAQQLGGLPQNIVQVSSSRQDEISLDDENGGGLATQAWRDCMLGEAEDLNHSGGISVDEISVCAQAKLDKRFERNIGYPSPHIAIGGNKGFIPSMVGDTPPPQGTQPTVATLANQLAVRAQVNAALADINEQRDAKRIVSVKLNNPVLNIGKDALNFSVTSSDDGYLYLVLLGSDGKSFYMLFPNELDQHNVIKAGETLQLPRDKWEIKAQGPSGTDRMLVIVSESPRDLFKLGKDKSGPFVTTLTDSAGRANLQWLLSTSANLASNECSYRGHKRNRTVAQKCSDAFGAALVDIVEK